MELEPELMLQEARESVEAAQSYRRELSQRLQGLREARRQIKESASQTRDVLKQHFNDLKGTLAKLLDERLVTLLQEVDTIEQETIKPLDDCQKLIEHGVNTAEDLVQEGELAIRGGVGEQNEKLWSFTKKASHIQLDSLPEVPLLVDVPCLSAQLDDSILNIVKDHIFKHGTVASRPPVQIEELIEKPGGIIVRWCKVDDDFTAQDYRLQFRKCTSNHFEDVYVGSETEFIVLHIDPNVDYQFRVCARGDGRQEWSPWSVPQIGHSTLVPHEWTAGFEGYSLSSRRNIALRNDAESSGVLYSSAPTYFCGQTLTFRVETVGQPDRRDSIGVCAEKQNGYDSLQRDQAVCISTNGKESEAAQSCPTLCDSHGLQSPRLLCQWDFPSKSTGVGCHFLLQGIFPTQGLNLGLPHCRQTLYPRSHQGSPFFKRSFLFCSIFIFFDMAFDFYSLRRL